MKRSFFLVALTFSFVALAKVPERSLPGSTKLLDLEPGTRILITEDLKVNQEDRSSMENVMSRENWSGIGPWCYMNDNTDRVQLPAGSLLVVSDVSIEPGNAFTSKYLTINTLAGITVQCLGSMNKGMTVKKLEKVFKGNIKFIK